MGVGGEGFVAAGLGFAGVGLGFAGVGLGFGTGLGAFAGVGVGAGSGAGLAGVDFAEGLAGLSCERVNPWLPCSAT